MSQEPIETALTNYFMRSSLYPHKERRFWNTEAKYILNLMEGAGYVYEPFTLEWLLSCKEADELIQRAGYRKQPDLLTDEEMGDIIKENLALLDDVGKAPELLFKVAQAQLDKKAL